MNHEQIQNDTKLVINIKHNEPVDLIDLSIGLHSLAKIFCRFNNGDTTAKLLVKEIRKSSIEIDLITSAFLSTIPIFSGVNNIVQFCNYIKLLVMSIKGKDEQASMDFMHENVLPNPTLKDMQDFGNSLKIIQNPKDTIDFSAKNITNSMVLVGCHIDGEESLRIQENLKILVSENNANIKEKQLFRWVQTNFDKTNVGNKGIIENIYKEPLRVTFVSDIVKNQMIGGKDWQNKFYVVDVEIQYSEKKPKLYKIINNYADENFLIDE
jgi:hypothetical protein